MSQSRWETWAVEKRIYSLLAGDGVLWSNIGGQLFEGAIPRGTSTRAPAIFGIVREVALDDSLLVGVSSGAGSNRPAWTTYDYEVVVTGETESYGELLASNADRIYADLHGTGGVVDGNDISLFVVGTVKKRYVRDGRVFKELGHKVRALVKDSLEDWARCDRLYLRFGTKTGGVGEFDIVPYVDTCDLKSHYDIASAKFSYDFTLAGFLQDGANALVNMPTYLGVAGKTVTYGPEGSTSGKRRMSDEPAILTEFDWLHDDMTGGVRWTATIHTASLLFDVWP
jgi:hypothetical protein